MSEEFLREFPESYNVLNFPFRIAKRGRFFVVYEHITTGERRAVPSYVARFEPPSVSSPPPGRWGLTSQQWVCVRVLTLRTLVLISVLAPLIWLLSL